MTILKENVRRDIEKIKKFSLMVEKKLEEFENKDVKKLENINYEELQDLNYILQITDYIVCKHEDKKQMRSMLKEFVGIINNSVNSMGEINDDIDELVISAENTIGRIKEIQGNMSDNSLISQYCAPSNNLPQNPPQKSSNNLTKSAEAIYTQEYQSKSKVKHEQVI